MDGDNDTFIAEIPENFRGILAWSSNLSVALTWAKFKVTDIVSIRTPVWINNGYNGNGLWLCTFVVPPCEQSGIWFLDRFNAT